MNQQRYLIRIENKKKHRPQEIRQVLSEYVRVSHDFGVSLRNFRVSEIAIEFDLFANEKDRIDKAVKRFSELGNLLSERDLGKDPEIQGKTETVKSVIGLFNEQRYWECHEVMETIWRREKDPVEKQVQQGIILAVSALVHAQKNENDVCLGMIPRSIAKLIQSKDGRYYGMNLEALKDSMQEMLENREVSFPKI